MESYIKQEENKEEKSLFLIILHYLFIYNCKRSLKIGDIDESGRRRPIPIEGSEFSVNLDTLIPAIGQEPNIS